MLIYLVIAAELGILYTAFWYIYIREPKPRKLYKPEGNLWGSYSDPHFTAGGADPTLTNPTGGIAGWMLPAKPVYIQLEKHQKSAPIPHSIYREGEVRHFLRRMVTAITTELDKLNTRRP